MGNKVFDIEYDQKVEKLVTAKQNIQKLTQQKVEVEKLKKKVFRAQQRNVRDKEELAKLANPVINQEGLKVSREKVIQLQEMLGALQSELQSKLQNMGNSSDNGEVDSTTVTISYEELKGFEKLEEELKAFRSSPPSESENWRNELRSTIRTELLFTQAEKKESESNEKLKNRQQKLKKFVEELEKQVQEASTTANANNAPVETVGEAPTAVNANDLLMKSTEEALEKATQKLKQMEQEIIDCAPVIVRKGDERETESRQILTHKSAAIMTAGVGIGAIVGALTPGFLAGVTLGGAAIGSVVPGLGTAIGAAIGLSIALVAIGVSWLYTKHEEIPAVGEVIEAKARTQEILK
jgi:hypothetical protein